MAQERVVFKSVTDRGVRSRKEQKARVYVTVEPVGPDFVTIRTRVGLRLFRGRGYTHSLGSDFVTVSNDWRVGWDG